MEDNHSAMLVVTRMIQINLGKDKDFSPGTAGADVSMIFLFSLQSP
jgi:hypothetical protein